MTDVEAVTYLREWGLHDCWNPKMQEAVAVVCDLADKSIFTKEQLEQLDWLLNHSVGRTVKFLDRFLNKNERVSRVVFENLIHQGKDGKP